MAQRDLFAAWKRLRELRPFSAEVGEQVLVYPDPTVDVVGQLGRVVLYRRQPWLVDQVRYVMSPVRRTMLILKRVPTPDGPLEELAATTVPMP